MRAPSITFAGIVAALAAGSAYAQDGAVPQLATELVYDSCLEYLVGQLTLDDNADLRAKGFSSPPERKQHPTQGTVETLTAKVGQSEISFGGIAKQRCIVQINGPERLKALDAVKHGMADLPFKLGPLSVPQPGMGILHEGFKGEADEGIFYNITLMTIPDTAPGAPVIISVFLSSE